MTGKIKKPRKHSVARSDPIKAIQAKEGKTMQKIKNNEIFVNACVSALRNPQFKKHGNIFYLDGPNARTTEMLAARIPRERLMPVSKDITAYNKFVKLVPKQNAFNETISSLLADNNGLDPSYYGPFAAVWLDYCGTLRGNKVDRKRGHDPVSDLKRMLDTDFRYVTDNTVFAVTFCGRGNSKNPVTTPKRMEAEINKIIADRGYLPTMKLTNYHRLMSFGITILKKV